MNDHNEDDQAPGTHVLFTFACGAVAGAAVALMFAPAKGRDTRELLAQRSRRAKAKGLEMLGEHGERLSAAVERSRDTAMEFRERVGHAVEQGKAGYRAAVRQGQDVAKDAMQGAGDTLDAVRGATHASDPTN